MHNGKVISNTHRILDVEEFRGFTISDPIAPIIFINGADAKAAQIFTLIHELAHLWLGQSGVSIISIDPSEHGEPREIERICNEIAAEVLVPEAVFKTKWEHKDSIDENSKKQAKYFRVSPIVIARRAWDLNLISSDNFFNYYNSQRKNWRLLKKKRKGGGDYYNNLLMMNGRDISQAILESVYSQNMLIRNGARLLGTKPHNLDEFARREGIL